VKDEPVKQQKTEVGGESEIRRSQTIRQIRDALEAVTDPDCVDECADALAALERIRVELDGPRQKPVEQVRRLVWDKLVMDYDWHEYAIADAFDVESRAHALGKEIIRLLGPPANVRVISTTDELCSSPPSWCASASEGAET
jgi:hypothetical protein